LRRTGLLACAAVTLAGCGDDDATGPPPFDGCTTFQTITVGGTAQGTLAQGDCQLDVDDTFADFYELELTAARQVTITLTSTDFNAYLLLFRRTGQLIDQNDDMSQSDFDAQLVVNLSAGTYVIAANSANVDSGAYTLTVQ
jgi:hypothetical protein